MNLIGTNPAVDCSTAKQKRKSDAASPQLPADCTVNCIAATQKRKSYAISRLPADWIVQCFKSFTLLKLLESQVSVILQYYHFIFSCVEVWVLFSHSFRVVFSNSGVDINHQKLIQITNHWFLRVIQITNHKTFSILKVIQIINQRSHTFLVICEFSKNDSWFKSLIRIIIPRSCFSLYKHLLFPDSVSLLEWLKTEVWVDLWFMMYDLHFSNLTEVIRIFES